MQLFQNISYLDVGKGEIVGALEDAGQLTRVGVAMWKAWPAIKKCLLKFSIIVDLSVVTVLPSLRVDIKEHRMDICIVVL